MSRSPHAPHPPLTMLIIDNHASFIRALAALLRRDGATVDVVSPGGHALARLQDHAMTCSCVTCRCPSLTARPSTIF